MSLSDEELHYVCEEPLQICAVPVHTVAVEGAAKVVAEAASQVVGEQPWLDLQPSPSPRAAANRYQQKVLQGTGQEIGGPKKMIGCLRQ